VKCDEKLGRLLREKYESVLDSPTLGRGGIEVICSGQLSRDEVVDLVRFSWNYC
jgi:predicted DNA-binding protein (MmcQ/YjbR family)